MTAKEKRKMRGHAKMYIHERFKNIGGFEYHALTFTEQMRLCEIVLKRYDPKRDLPIDIENIMKEELEGFYGSELQSQTADWTIPVYAQDQGGKIWG